MCYLIAIGISFKQTTENFLHFLHQTNVSFISLHQTKKFHSFVFLIDKVYSIVNGIILDYFLLNKKNREIVLLKTNIFTSSTKWRFRTWKSINRATIPSCILWTKFYRKIILNSVFELNIR